MKGSNQVSDGELPIIEKTGAGTGLDRYVSDVSLVSLLKYWLFYTTNVTFL